MLIVLLSLLNSVPFSLLSRCSRSVLASSIYARATDTTDSAPAPPMIDDVGGGSGGGNGKDALDGDEGIISSQRPLNFFGLELNVVVVCNLVLLWCIVLW